MLFCLTTTTSNNEIYQQMPVDIGKVSVIRNNRNDHNKKFPEPTKPFERYNDVGVVMVTKVHWQNDLGKLKQMICLFNAAYNHYTKYDIIVFTTTPWSNESITDLQQSVGVSFDNINIQVVIDSPPLEDVLHDQMSKNELQVLQERCGCCNETINETLTWFHHCLDGHLIANLAYSWQSEFRAYHIWTQHVLKKYKYMIWLDADAWCTKPWLKDPIKLMVENDLVLMYDNFGETGTTNNTIIQDKMAKAYGPERVLCKVLINEDKGHFETIPCNNSIDFMDSNQEEHFISHVHGFHHITNLDFYRSKASMKFLKILVEDYKFSREWDDQLAVTIPAAMDAPNRSWYYHSHGINPRMFHNGYIDSMHWKNNSDLLYRWGYHRNWKDNVATKSSDGDAGGHTSLRNRWDYGKQMCDSYIKYRD